MEKIMPDMTKIESGQPVFSVFDSKAKYYTKFFVVKSTGEALRGFEDVANDKSTSIGIHPEDFLLFHIGYWDEWKGVLTPITHVCLGKAIDYVKTEIKIKEVQKDEKRNEA